MRALAFGRERKRREEAGGRAVLPAPAVVPARRAAPAAALERRQPTLIELARSVKPEWLKGKMKITEVDLEDRLFLVGPPGVGKTTRIMALATEEARRLGRTFVDVRCLLKSGGCRVGGRTITIEDVKREPEKYYLFLRLSAPHVFPEDLQYPRPKGDAVKFLLPEVLHLFTLPGIAGVLFIDELTNVQRDDQMAMYYTLILEKEFGYTGRLSDGVKVVAAGNPPEWSSIARGLAAPLLNRTTKVDVEPPSVDEWIDYMFKTYGDNWRKEIAAFLKAFPKYLLGKPAGEETLEPFPTPRAWTTLATMPPEKVAKYAAGIVGSEAAAALFSFLKNTPLTFEELVRDPSRFRELERPERKYVTLLHLAVNANRLLREGWNIIEWLADNDREALATLIALMPEDARLELITRLPQDKLDALIDTAVYLASFAAR